MRQHSINPVQSVQYLIVNAMFLLKASTQSRDITKWEPLDNQDINGVSSMGKQKNSFSSLQKSELVLALLASPIIPLMGADFSLYPIVDTERVIWSECNVSGQRENIHIIVRDVRNHETRNRYSLSCVIMRIQYLQKFNILRSKILDV